MLYIYYVYYVILYYKILYLCITIKYDVTMMQIHICKGRYHPAKGI